MSELTPSLRVLATAMAPVPGANGHTPALRTLVSAIRAEVDVVTVKTERLGHLDYFGSARMLRVPMGTWSLAERRDAFCRAVSRQLDAHPYEVVHARGPFAGAVVAGRKESIGCLLVYEVATFVDEEPGEFGQQGPWLAAHEECLRAADLVLVPTFAAARSLEGQVLDSRRIEVLGPAVDIDEYDWGLGECPEDCPTRLLYVGPFSADRDMPTLVEAVRRVAKERRIEVMFAGETDPRLRARMKRIIRAFGLDGVVQVRGELPGRALPALIAGSHAALVTAGNVARFQEQGDLPEPLLEFLASRCPVIAAAVPGVSDVLRDEHEGLLYGSGDEESLTEAIITLVDDPGLRRRLAASAYQRIRAQFSGGVRRRRLAELYERLVPGSQGTDPWLNAFNPGEEGPLEVTSTFFHSPQPAQSDDLPAVPTRIEPSPFDAAATERPAQSDAPLPE